MQTSDLSSVLRDAVAGHGLVPGELRKTKRGQPGVTLVWLRPEPVPLRADPAKGLLLLEAYLPFVLPGGRLQRRIKAWLAERDPAAICISRNGHLTLGLPAAGDWHAVLARLLAIAGDLRDMLRAEWPDYANGVFAKALA